MFREILGKSIKHERRKGRKVLVKVTKHSPGPRRCQTPGDRDE